MSASVDIHSRITDQIIAQLQAGVRPWQKSWSTGSSTHPRPRRSTGEAYRGINVVLLWMAAASAGYAADTWMTYKQAAALGGQVRRGERSTLVVYANTVTRENPSDPAAPEGEGPRTRRFGFLKGYYVFNVDQIDGLPKELQGVTSPAPIVATSERDARADAFVALTGAAVRNGGGSAFYSPAGDFIQVPDFAAFESAEAYYATLLHELVHWTSPPARLHREFGQKRWGDQGYAQEELVAELGAAFLCADLGLSAEPRADHASYIGSWLEVLRRDKRAIITAATAAQKAVDFLQAMQQPKEVAA